MMRVEMIIIGDDGDGGDDEMVAMMTDDGNCFGVGGWW